MMDVWNHSDEIMTQFSKLLPFWKFQQEAWKNIDDV